MAGGFDVRRDARAARSLIGLVPQEIATDAFETVQAAARFSRGLFGKAQDDAVIERVLKALSLWDKRDVKIMTLSGGMKRRMMIAKALVHEPKILFLDEPSAGVDVELRRDMWQMVRELRASGVTIILTTHYIEEAEEMADRIGIINRGELILVEDKAQLVRKLGRKELRLHLAERLESIPAPLEQFKLTLSADGTTLVYSFETEGSAHASPPCCVSSTNCTSTFATSRPSKVRWRTSSCRWSGARHEPACGARNLQVRDGAHPFVPWCRAS